MKKLALLSVLLIAFFVISCLSVTTFAQEGGGLNSATYLNRANQAAGNNLPIGPGAPLPGGISADEMARFQQGNKVLTGQTTQAPVPEVKMITVVEGELVISAKSGLVLQKPERKQVPETLKDNYYDDGTHGDEVAGDGIYSNVVIRKDVISKDEYKLRLSLESLINKIAKDNPVEFYRLFVASDGHDPEIPSYGYWKSRRDEFVNDYKTRVLAPYKDANGNFYEVYEPPTPTVPNIPQVAGVSPGQQSPQPQPRNVGVAQGVQNRVNQMPAGADEAGINQVGGGSYLGEQNRMK